MSEVENVTNIVCSVSVEDCVKRNYNADKFHTGAGISWLLAAGVNIT
jgi:hypothetical protein